MQSVLPVALTFDHLGGGQDVGLGRTTTPDRTRDDLTVAMPRVLDLLAEVDAAATFYIEGWSILHFPQIVTGLQRKGHRVGLHGWVHEYPWRELTTDQRSRILQDGAAALRNAGAIDPGFRAPAGYLAADDIELLRQVGMTHGSSLVSDLDDGYTTHSSPLGYANVSFPWEAVDYWQFHLHPSDPADDATWIPRWRALVSDAKAAQREHLVFVIHPFFAGIDSDRFNALAEFVRELAADPGIALTTVEALCASAKSDTPPQPVTAEPALPSWMS